jgi:hypothetical protein
MYSKGKEEFQSYYSKEGSVSQDLQEDGEEVMEIAVVPVPIPQDALKELLEAGWMPQCVVPVLRVPTAQERIKSGMVRVLDQAMIMRRASEPIQRDSPDVVSVDSFRSSDVPA